MHIVTTKKTIGCLTADEMEALGWRKWYGVWREPITKNDDESPIKN